MRHLTIAITAIAVSALFVAPVSAERLQGGPMKQNGQCWKSNSGGSESTWGIWVACPSPAAAPSVARPAHRRT
jgi:hypothetical protein